MKCANLLGQGRWKQEQIHLDPLCKAAVCRRGSSRPVTILPCCQCPSTLAHLSISTADNMEQLGSPFNTKEVAGRFKDCPQCSHWMTGPLSRINLRQAQRYWPSPASMDIFGCFFFSQCSYSGRIEALNSYSCCLYPGRFGQHLTMTLSPCNFDYYWENFSLPSNYFTSITVILVATC